MTFFEKFDAVFYQETMLSSGVFRRETARGFYPWGKVDSPRKRVAEGLCGWRHGNSFPMAQNAQSHRQMRSIPHCPKAVFYVFVFHSILNSAIKNNHCPPVFSTEPVLSLVEGGEDASEQVGSFERVGGCLDVGGVEAKLRLAVERLTLNLRPTFFSF